MLKRRNIGKCLMLGFYVSILLCSFASADDSKLNNSKSDEISDSIKEFESDSSFIAYRGNVPETIDQEWENLIADCWLNLTLMGPSYSEFDRSMSGVAASDILIIELNPAYKEEMNDSRIDEIYQKIEDYCERQEGISETPVVFIWAQEEDFSLPDYGSETFEEAKKLFSGFIASRGTIPEIHTEEEKREWVDLLAEYSRSSSRLKELNPYLTSFGGPVNSFGADIHGYLIVGFEEAAQEKVNESMIDEIYQVIDEHFEQKGISDVPVVFTFIRITDDLAPADESNVKINKNEPILTKDENLTVINNETTQKTNEAINKTPGFTSILSILGLLLLLINKRL